jgi:hypothetical protein
VKLAAFLDGKDSIDDGDTNLLYGPARPVDFQLLNLGGRTQSKVDARI